jgi:diguanylate cyclase (GGDEF)-like protein
MLVYIILFLLITSVLPMAIISLVYFQTAQRSLIREAQDSSLQMIQTEAYRFDLFAENSRGLMTAILANSDLQQWLNLPQAATHSDNDYRVKSIAKLLNQYIRSTPGAVIDIYTSAGRHYSTDAESAGATFSSQDILFFINKTIATQNKNYWSGVSDDNLHPALKSSKVVVTSSIFKNEEKKGSVFPMGLITITYPVNQFSFLQLDDDSITGLTSHRQTLLLDQDNRIIYSADQALIGTAVELPADGSTVASSGVERKEYKGVDQIIAFSQIKPAGWRIVDEIPVQTILDRNQEMLNTIIYLFLLMVFFLAVTSIIFINSVVSPINRLTMMFQEIQNGTFDWDDRPSPPRFSELQDLYYWFNAFLDTLEKNKAFEEKLKTSEARYHNLFNNSPIAIWEEDFSPVVNELDAICQHGVVDLETYLREHIDFAKSLLAQIRIVEVNQATLTQYQAGCLEELESNFPLIVKPLLEPELIDQLMTIAGRGQQYERQVVNNDLTGKRMDLDLRWSIAPGSETSMNRIFVTTRNITDQKKDERIQRAVYQISQAASSTKNLDDLYRSIHLTLNDLMPAENFYIALYNPNEDLLHFVYFVDEYDKTPEPRKPSRGLTGYVLQTGKSLLVPPEEFKRLRETGEIIRMGADSVDWMGVPLIINDKTIGVLAVQIYREGVHYTVEQRDILTFVSTQIAMAIDRKQAEENLRYTSTHDPITGIYNRAYFEEEVNRLSKGRQLPTSVVIVDMDGLKRINDTYGHPIGDESIRTVAHLLKSIFRGSDVVARFGGDEFGILLPFADERTVNKIINRMNTKISNYNETSSIKISLSIGCCTVTDGNDLVQAINVADQNMYKEKVIKKARLASGE